MHYEIVQKLLDCLVEAFCGSAAGNGPEGAGEALVTRGARLTEAVAAVRQAGVRQRRRARQNFLNNAAERR